MGIDPVKMGRTKRSYCTPPSQPPPEAAARALSVLTGHGAVQQDPWVCISVGPAAPPCRDVAVLCL
jgi:hypothetical protein